LSSLNNPEQVSESLPPQPDPFIAFHEACRLHTTHLLLMSTPNLTVLSVPYGDSWLTVHHPTIQFLMY